MDGECCDMSNIPNPDDPIKYSPVQYHSAPSLQFENVENIGNASGGEFMVGQVFYFKSRFTTCCEVVLY